MCNLCNGITQNGDRCRNDHWTSNHKTHDGKYYCKHHHPNKEEVFGYYRPIIQNKKDEYIKSLGQDINNRYMNDGIRLLCLQILTLYPCDDFDKMRNEILPLIFKKLEGDKTKITNYDANTALMTNQIFEIFAENRLVSSEFYYNYNNNNNYIDMLNLLLKINDMDNINNIHIIIKQYEKFLFGVMDSKYYTFHKICSNRVRLPFKNKELITGMVGPLYGNDIKTKEKIHANREYLSHKKFTSLGELVEINNSFLSIVNKNYLFCYFEL